MKFFLIFPEMWASTTCLLSSSTRNMALGKGSSTVAITSIASSLDMLWSLYLRPVKSGKYRGTTHKFQTLLPLARTHRPFIDARISAPTAPMSPSPGMSTSKPRAR